MSSIYGKNIKISIFGQSHSPAIGVNIDGLPAGFKTDFNELQEFMKRRMPGNAAFSTKRREEDKPEFLSGLTGINKNSGFTCGAPLAAIIRNTDMHPSDYKKLGDVPRPSHADFTSFVKYGRNRDVNGGGSFSGRLTAPLCLAGGICLQLLKKKGINIFAHIFQIADVKDLFFDPVNAGEKENRILKKADFPVLDKKAGEKMSDAIEEARQAGDSLGGIIECAAEGLPAGLGEPMFDGMENRLSAIIFGIPAVKGIEFGNGFSSTQLRGSQNNDAFIISDGKIKTSTNRHGGILGGITSGMPLLFRVAVKPTPSISIEQGSVSFSKLKEVRLKIKGRHDPCIVPRAVPCVEAAVAIAIYDALLENSANERK